jgi:hypothetical protein
MYFTVTPEVIGAGAAPLTGDIERDVTRSTAVSKIF